MAITRPLVEFRATSTSPDPPRTQVRVELSAWEPMPRELRVVFARADARFDFDCAAPEQGTLVCEGEVPAHGEGRVIVSYRAVDDILESVEEELRLHGDEVEVTLRGGFDDDASLNGLSARIYRAADEGVRLEAALPTPGYFMLVNESDGDIVVESDGLFLLGYIVRVNDDGSWGDMRRRSIGGCITIPPVTLSPGKRDLVVGRGLLWPGRYLYVLDFDDVVTLGDEAVSRRITARFDVVKDPPWQFVDWWPGARSFALEYVELDFWAGASPPLRPGQTRPAGLEGSQRADAARLLRDGDDIAGVLSPERHRHTYRFQLQPNQEGVVRIFARCTSAPCSARVGIYSGNGDEVTSAQSSRLHRDPPAWSVQDGIIRDEEDTLVIGCDDKCEEGWEFYGRVHVREIPPDERY